MISQSFKEVVFEATLQVEILFSLKLVSWTSFWFMTGNCWYFCAVCNFTDTHRSILSPNTERKETFHPGSSAISPCCQPGTPLAALVSPPPDCSADELYITEHFLISFSVNLTLFTTELTSVKLRTLISIPFERALVPSWIVISTPARLLLHYNSSPLTSATIHSSSLSIPLNLSNNPNSRSENWFYQLQKSISKLPLILFPAQLSHYNL